MLFFLRAISSLLAATPEFICRALCVVLAELAFFVLPRRRRSILSNLSHAFPEKPHDWLVRMGRRSFRRMIETGMLGLIFPRLGLKRIRCLAAADASLGAVAKRMLESGRGTVLTTPHLGAWDFGSAIPAFYNGPVPETVAIYRPLRNEKLNDWVRQSRERFGTRMLSRKAGFAEGMQVLRRGGVMGILFDQNARDSGELSLFFDRVCSTSNLPGLLVQKFDANLAMFLARRTAFWRYELKAEVFEEVPRDAGAVTALLNRRLEDMLRSDEELSSTWLWVHNRWKTQVEPRTRFRLEHKRSILPPDADLPRTTRFFIRLPDAQPAALEALPFILRLRQSRPDAALTALAPAALAETARASGAFDEIIPLPPRKTARRRLSRKMRRRYPDCWIVLATDRNARVEARLARCPQRFGMLRPGGSAHGLTHTSAAASAQASDEHNDAFAWRADYEAFFRHFGLREL